MYSREPTVRSCRNRDDKSHIRIIDPFIHLKLQQPMDETDIPLVDTVQEGVETPTPPADSW